MQEDQSGVCRDPAEERWQLELSGIKDAETERGLCNNLTSKVAEIGDGLSGSEGEGGWRVIPQSLACILNG